MRRTSSGWIIFLGIFSNAFFISVSVIKYAIQWLITDMLYINFWQYLVWHYEEMLLFFPQDWKKSEKIKAMLEETSRADSQHFQ